MSCCLIFQKENEIIMGADTALCGFIENECYRVNNNQQKIFSIKDSLIFCSGDMFYVDKVTSYINAIEEIFPEYISSFLKSINFTKNENIFNIEIILCKRYYNSIKVFQISEYNNFEVIEIDSPKSNTRILSGGINTQKCLDLATQEAETKSDLVEIYQNVYNKLSSEQIGGNLIIWKYSDNIEVVYNKPIQEKNIKYLKTHSIVADAIVGRLIVGNNLTIQNDNNTFIVDNDGVRIYDAIIDITTTNGNNRIRIDPDNGFKIQKLVGGSWTDKFYANANGDITFSGALSGATGDFTGRITANEGYIGGLTINAQGIQKDANNFIRSNGDLKWGALSIIGTTAIFNGNFYANNLLGLVQSYQIGSVNADTITTGTLTAIDIYGSNIYWSGVWMGTDGTGNSAIAADNKIYITQGYRAVLLMDSDRTRLFHPDEVTIGWTSPTGNIRLNGTILTKDVNSASGYGISESFLVNTPTGNKKMNFINGLLTIEVPQGSLPPITGEDTFFVETGFTVVIPTTAGKVADIELPFDFVLDSVRLVASKPDVIGDAEIDISLKPFATWNLASEASIVGSSPVAIVNGKKYEDTVLDGWTTSFSKGDYLTIDLVSSNTFTQLELSIKGRK